MEKEDACVNAGGKGKKGVSETRRELRRGEKKEEKRRERTLASSARCFKTIIASSFCSTVRAGTPAWKIEKTSERKVDQDESTRSKKRERAKALNAP